ncbi:MAG: hypothetical protein WDO18_15785 [Acidobacteriota bacterium]
MPWKIRSAKCGICGDAGLIRYSGETSRRFTTADGLRADIVAQVAPAADGSLWIGYREALGLTHLSFAGEGPNAKAVAEQVGAGKSNAPMSDKTMFLAFDGKGRLWSGTDHGIDMLDRGNWSHLGRRDGLIWDDCSSQAFWAANDGVWIGTSKGLSFYHPREVPLPAVAPNVVFTSVRIGDGLWDPQVDQEIPFDQRDLDVQFAALTFAHDAGVTFNVTLDGRAQEAGGTQRAFTLSEGTHTLEVTAKNAQGRLSAEPARLEFVCGDAMVSFVVVPPGLHGGVARDRPSDLEAAIVAVGGGAASVGTRGG